MSVWSGEGCEQALMRQKLARCCVLFYKELLFGGLLCILIVFKKKKKIYADSQPFFNLLVLVLMIFCIEQYI